MMRTSLDVTDEGCRFQSKHSRGLFPDRFPSKYSRGLFPDRHDLYMCVGVMKD
jgi:hypothetical protein